MPNRQNPVLWIPAQVVVSLAPWPISTLLRILLRRWLRPVFPGSRILRLIGWILLLWFFWR